MRLKISRTFAFVVLLTAISAGLLSLAVGTLIWAIQGFEAHDTMLASLSKLGLAAILSAGGWWAGSLARNGRKASDQLEHVYVRRP